jgi:hypothetical protein
MATNAALVHLAVPSANIYGNNLQLPPEGLEISSMAFVNAGKLLCDSRGAADVIECINKAMTMEFLSKLQPRVCEYSMFWSTSYMGKATSTFAPRILATEASSNIWTAAFKTNFIPFWMHSNNRGVRATRVDMCQHEALHSINAATQLVLNLTDNERMAVQRLALSTLSAGIMTVEEAIYALGIATESLNCTPKCLEEFVKIMQNIGGFKAAQLLHFSRMAAISESIIVYDLGSTTRRKQVLAIKKRFLLDELFEDTSLDDEELLKLAPQHAMFLFGCTDCRRIANAVCVNSGKKCKTKFNELGTSGSMLWNDHISGVKSLRCAKRCSASHKSIVACEAEMSRRCIDSEQSNEQFIESMLTNSSAQRPSGMLSRMRRDSKNCMEQKECSSYCGSQNMLKVNIIGKAVRIWGNWYALCSFCGCFMRFTTMNRYEAELCCLRCDHKMLNRNKEERTVKTLKTTPQCRYCGKVHTTPSLALSLSLSLSLLATEYETLKCARVCVCVCSWTLNAPVQGGSW